MSDRFYMQRDNKFFGKRKKKNYSTNKPIKRKSKCTKSPKQS